VFRKTRWRELKGEAPDENIAVVALAGREQHLALESRRRAENQYLKIENGKQRQEFLYGRWKSGNPKPGFPLSHRPDSLRRKDKTRPFTQTT
jgi:hypothetical protein